MPRNTKRAYGALSQAQLRYPPPGKPDRSALYSGLFGHKSSKITEIYTHISNKNLSKIRNPLESIVGETDKEKIEIYGSDRGLYPK